MFTFIKSKDVISGYKPEDDTRTKQLDWSEGKTKQDALAELNRISLNDFPQIIQNFNEWLKDDKIYTQTEFQKKVRKTSPFYPNAVACYLSEEGRLAMDYDEDEILTIEDAYEEFYGYTRRNRERYSIIKLDKDKYVIAKPFYTTKYQIKFDKGFIQLMLQTAKDKMKEVYELINGAE